MNQIANSHTNSQGPPINGYFRRSHLFPEADQLNIMLIVSLEPG